MSTVNTLSNTFVDIKMDCGVTWSSSLKYATIYYPGLISVKTVEQINEQFVNDTLKSSTVYDPVPVIHEVYADSRDSTPSPERLYIDESRDTVETVYYSGRIRVKTVEQINEEFFNGILKYLTVYDPVPLICEEYANSRDSTPSPGRLCIDESEDSVETAYNPGFIRVKTVEQINEEFVNNTLQSSTVCDPVPLIHEEYANSRDSAPSPRTLYIDESRDTVKTVEQINKEFANGTLNSSTVNDPAPLIYEEYANSRDSTPSPGRLYIDESRDTVETEEQIDEEFANGTLFVDVKTIKKAYKRFFPHNPKPKLRRQRLNAYRVAQKLDLDHVKKYLD